MRAQVRFIDGKLRSVLGRLKPQHRAAERAPLRQLGMMHTRRTPGARTPTDNDLEKTKLWSSSIQI